MTAKIDYPSKAGRMNSLSIKAAGMIFAGLLLVAVSVNIITASIVEGEITAVGAAWIDYETHDAPKMRIIGQLRGTLDYGGMIHELKNYVLRGGAQRLAAARSTIKQAKGLIADYAPMA